MKRLHVNLAVADLAASIRFYSSLFGADPTVRKHDYAKWMLEDPRVNFAISDRGSTKGIQHLGIQAESEGELAEVYARLKSAQGPVLEEGDTHCCYAQSEKSWIADPDGVAWEAFLTRGARDDFGESGEELPAAASTCCAPTAKKTPGHRADCC